MRVLYLLNYAGNGGSERYIETLISALDERITPFFAYNIRGALVERLEQSGVPCFQISMSGPFDFGASRELAQICSEHKIDVIHTHFMREMVIATRTKVRFTRTLKIVNTVHMTERKRGMTGLLNWWYSHYNSANIAVSRAVLENLRREHVKNAVLIYNGVDVGYFHPKPVAHDEFRVACVGRFSVEKGQRYLIEVARLLPNINFVFAGEGELLQECKGSAPSNCEFIGYAEDTRELLNSADLYVCPSLEEALGLSVLEAMACGLPTVVTDAGGLPELVTPECGDIVPKGDSAALANAIRNMANDPIRRAKCAVGALRRVREHFNLDSTAEGIFKLYGD
ncbi:MAG: glycosyltransferase [Oscillospiraceae bacterium]|jgi:glycosyltransferase involved in cell wall biosynthesis|nr:glycosyltransferase [Oscillospiraceae bacterium]